MLFQFLNSGFVNIIADLEDAHKWSIEFTSQTPYNTILRHTIYVDIMEY